MHHFSLGISLFLSLFNQKKSLAPSPSRFLLGLGIGENSCPPQKNTKTPTEVDEKRCCFDRVFGWQCFSWQNHPFFCLGLPLFSNLKKNAEAKKFNTKSCLKPSTTSPPQPAGNSAALLLENWGFEHWEEQSFGSPNQQQTKSTRLEMWLGTRWLIGWNLPWECLLKICTKYTKFLNVQCSLVESLKQLKPSNVSCDSSCSPSCFFAE